MCMRKNNYQYFIYHRLKTWKKKLHECILLTSITIYCILLLDVKYLLIHLSRICIEKKTKLIDQFTIVYTFKRCTEAIDFCGVKNQVKTVLPSNFEVKLFFFTLDVSG